MFCSLSISNARALGLSLVCVPGLVGCFADVGESGSATAASQVTTQSAPTSTSGETDSGGAVTDSEGTGGASATTGALTSGPLPTTGPGPSTSTTTTTTTTTATTTSPFTSGDDSESGWWETTTSGDMCKNAIDIVFVMDVSTSMAAILTKLANEILVVDQAITALDLATEVHYGLVVFVDDASLINNGMAYADATALQSDFIMWSSFTQSNSQTDGMGSNGDWPENTIDALYMAAYGFQWRPTGSTLRMIIHTTDDTFGDKGAVQSGEVIQHSYDETVLGLQEREIRVFSFADNDNTGGPANNQDVSMGFFTPYQGKTPIPEATDGGAFNINQVLANQLSLSAAIGASVEESLCSQYIPQ